jgi:hypothetical protein
MWMLPAKERSRLERRSAFVSQSSGGAQIFFRIIQQNAKESIQARK